MVDISRGRWANINQQQQSFFTPSPQLRSHNVVSHLRERTLLSQSLGEQIQDRTPQCLFPQSNRGGLRIDLPPPCRREKETIRLVATRDHSAAHPLSQPIWHSSRHAGVLCPLDSIASSLCAYGRRLLVNFIQHNKSFCIVTSRILFRLAIMWAFLRSSSEYLIFVS